MIRPYLIDTSTGLTALCGPTIDLRREGAILDDWVRRHSSPDTRIEIKAVPAAEDPEWKEASDSWLRELDEIEKYDDDLIRHLVHDYDYEESEDVEDGEDFLA